MYQTARKLHLWVGLILAVVLFVEAVTGLILAEPWLVSQGTPPTPQRHEQAAGQAPPREGAKPAPTGIFGVAKGLHQGRVGGMDLRWVVDLAAVGLAVLTVTGVYLAIPLLRRR